MTRKKQKNVFWWHMKWLKTLACYSDPTWWEAVGGEWNIRCAPLIVRHFNHWICLKNCIPSLSLNNTFINSSVNITFPEVIIISDVHREYTSKNQLRNNGIKTSLKALQGAQLICIFVGWLEMGFTVSADGSEVLHKCCKSFICS